MRYTLAILLIVMCLGGCDRYMHTIKYDLRETSEGGKKHVCSMIHIKDGIPMHGATYCEFNYARGYADGLEDCCKYPSRREHICHPMENK